MITRTKGDFLLKDNTCAGCKNTMRAGTDCWWEPMEQKNAHTGLFCDACADHHEERTIGRNLY